DTGHQLIQSPEAARRKLTRLEAGDPDQALGRLRPEAAPSFDLASELPLRASLIATPGARHIRLILLHHIAGDGGSMAPLAADLSRAYAARSAGHAPDWTSLPVQYADYALWQRDRLGDEDDPDSTMSAQIAYWRERLAGLPWQLEL